MTSSLLLAIRAVPMRCADCGMTTTQDLPCPESKDHAWETDDAAIARVVREWLREHEPPRDAVIRALWEACGGPSALPVDAKMSGPMADAIRALYRRAWEGRSKDMERYIGTKIILAEPMEQHTAVFAGLVRGDVTTIESDGHSQPGYKVVYEDGYASWSPKGTFERAYRRITDAELALLAPPAEAEHAGS